MTKLEFARAASRIAGSAFVAVAFLFLLSVASAQHEAMRALDSTNTGLSYSVARATVSKADEDRAEHRRLKSENAKLRVELRQLEREKHGLGGELYTRLQDVDLIARSIIKAGQCDSLPQGTNLPAVPDINLWRLVQLCAQQASIPVGAAQKVKELSAPNIDPTAVQRRVAGVERDIKENSDLRAANDAEIERLSKSVASADAVRNALQDVSVFEAYGVVQTLRLGWLSSVPPRVLPIILSFFAGMFGALLITLILVVYPNNTLNLTSSNSFGYRIGLGGLIAVAIFVVLGGGLAVVGSNDAVAMGNANFMFFCAIGILAGMFSDRAAGFLSNSASTFTGPGGTATTAKTAPRPASGPRPPSQPASSTGSPAPEPTRSASSGRRSSRPNPNSDEASEDEGHQP